MNRCIALPVSSNVAQPLAVPAPIRHITQRTQFAGASARQQACAMLLGSAFAALAPASAPAATRNGQLDPDFGIAGIQMVDFGVESAAVGLDIAPDGKVVLGCVVNGASGSDFGAARLLAEGSIDTEFSSDGRVVVAMSPGAGSDTATSVIAQADGKIVLLGSAQIEDQPLAPGRMAMARLNGDGSLDETFSGDGKTFIDFDLAVEGSDTAWDGLQLPDGKLIIVGDVATDNEGHDVAVAKLNVDGTRDSSFDDDGLVTLRWNADPVLRDESARSIALDSQGRIVIGASVQVGEAGMHDFAAARLLPDGQLDTGFGIDGRVVVAFDIAGTVDDQVLHVVVAADDSIYLVGTATTSDRDGAVAKLLEDGSLDAGFGDDGKVTVPFDLGNSNTDIFSAAIGQPDGALLLAGYATAGPGNDLNIIFARLLADGSADPNFGFAGKSVIALDIGGSLAEAALSLRFSDGAAMFGGYVDTGSYVSALVGRVVIEDLFTNGFEPD